VLIRRVDLDRIATGEIDLVLRRWTRPTVRAGGTLRTSIGLLDIVAVERIDEDDLTDGDARRAGCADRADVLASFAGRHGDWYRIVVALGGPDPREELRQRSVLDGDEIAEIERRLRRLDAASAGGPWTDATLAVIARRPGVRAGDLARELGRERDAFKVDVRKLKALGLTISLDVGYRLSPRAEALLSARLDGGPLD